MTSIKLSNFFENNEQAVLLNALAYALKRWGNPAEENEMLKIIAKIGNGEELVKSDVQLLLRFYSTMLKLFPSNKELQFKGIPSLREAANKMN
jgi:Ca2+-binding EF-hand superfamily protein